VYEHLNKPILQNSSYKEHLRVVRFRRAGVMLYFPAYPRSLSGGIPSCHVV